MKHIIMIAGAAALSFAGPAIAKPGHGQGNGHGNAYAYGYGHGQNADDEDDDGVGFNGQRFGYGAGGCPPGLAKKTPACIPPGQARKQGFVGQNAYAYQNPYAVSQVPYGYANPYAGGQVPSGYGNPYAMNPYSDYEAPAYGSPYGYGYGYSPNVVQQVIGSLIR